MCVHVSDFSKTQKMSGEFVENDSKMLKFVPDYFKARDICKKAVENRYLQ